MNKILEMISNEKVEWKKLGEIGSFYGGLTGKNKSDFTDGNCKYISYKNVFENISVKLDYNDMVNIKTNEKQRTLQYGDIIFTASSEILEESGYSSVVTSQLNEPIYLNSFCFFFRLNNEKLLLPDFSKYLFRSNFIRKEIIKTANGVTRFNVSKNLMAKIEIPIPSLETQERIVKTLDTMMDHFTQLQAELQARNRQYEHYRDKWLSEEYLNKLTENNNVRKTRLCEIAQLNRGKRVVRNQLSQEGLYPVFQNSLIPLGFYNNKNFSGEKTCIITAGAAGDIFYQEKDFWAADDVFVITTDETIDKYLYYFILNKQFILKSKVRRASVPRLSRESIEGLEILVPPIPVQEHVVSILDNFNKIVSDINEGLPKEIELRQKQYEYYRERLLDFKREED